MSSSAEASQCPSEDNSVSSSQTHALTKPSDTPLFLGHFTTTAIGVLGLLFSFSFSSSSSSFSAGQGTEDAEGVDSAGQGVENAAAGRAAAPPLAPEGPPAPQTNFRSRC